MHFVSEPGIRLAGLRNAQAACVTGNGSGFLHGLELGFALGCHESQRTDFAANPLCISVPHIIAELIGRNSWSISCSGPAGAPVKHLPRGA